jgi:hypothetical protein
MYSTAERLVRDPTPADAVPTIKPARADSGLLQLAAEYA